ncbi:MAG: hypothetical protein JRN58_07860 [Nitrososphaerota archaeon]|nr:hypothetical protein [Nitrososphaerota archaeon]
MMFRERLLLKHVVNFGTERKPALDTAASGVCMPYRGDIGRRISRAIRTDLVVASCGKLSAYLDDLHVLDLLRHLNILVRNVENDVVLSNPNPGDTW